MVSQFIRLDLGTIKQKHKMKALTIKCDSPVYFPNGLLYGFKIEKSLSINLENELISHCLNKGFVTVVFKEKEYECFVSQVSKSNSEPPIFEVDLTII